MTVLAILSNRLVWHSFSTITKHRYVAVVKLQIGVLLPLCTKSYTVGNGGNCREKRRRDGKGGEDVKRQRDLEIEGRGEAQSDRDAKGRRDREKLSEVGHRETHRQGERAYPFGSVPSPFDFEEEGILFENPRTELQYLCHPLVTRAKETIDGTS